MRYSDGQEIRVGDKVRMGNDDGGSVVCDISARVFTPEYPKNEWAYLGEGIVVVFPQFGVIHMKELESDLELIVRSD